MLHPHAPPAIPCPTPAATSTARRTHTHAPTHTETRGAKARKAKTTPHLPPPSRGWGWLPTAVGGPAGDLQRRESRGERGEERRCCDGDISSADTGTGALSAKLEPSLHGDGDAGRTRRSRVRVSTRTHAFEDLLWTSFLPSREDVHVFLDATASARRPVLHGGVGVALQNPRGVVRSVRDSKSFSLKTRETFTASTTVHGLLLDWIGKSSGEKIFS